MKTVLIVEDDREISHLLGVHLRDLNCEVTKSFDGKEGLSIALGQRFDLIVLDIMLPGMDGLEICRKLREHNKNTAILMLTSKSEEIDKVLGLEMGADDYMAKPFGIREFIARVKALFRRIESTRTDEETLKDITAGNLKIEGAKRRILIDGEKVELTPKEFELLYLLASNPGKAYSRESLLNRIWGYSYDGYEHTVNSHINRLRSKIEKNADKPEYILTVWGVGYSFNDNLGG